MGRGMDQGMGQGGFGMNGGGYGDFGGQGDRGFDQGFSPRGPGPHGRGGGFGQDVRELSCCFGLNHSFNNFSVKGLQIRVYI